MTRLVPFLAQDDVKDLLDQQNRFGGSSLRGTLIIVATVLAVSLIVVLGIVAFRTKFRPRKRRHHHHRPVVPVSSRSAGAPTAPTENQHRRKRRRRERLPRNPTLAETRGLPPVRDQEPPPPSY